MIQASSLAVVVLAAGKGKRMRSERAKVLHPLGGRPLVAHVLRAVAGLSPERTIVVVGHQAAAVAESLAGAPVELALQEEQRGTGHALRIARDQCLAGFTGDVLALYGDVPLLRTETLERLVAAHRSAGARLSLLTTVLDEPRGYGRIVRDQDGRLARIVEERDANEQQRAIAEVNPGIYCARSDFLFPALDRLRADNAQQELYLTDVVAQAVAEGGRILTEPVAPAEVRGINSRADLAALEAELRDRTLARHLAAGVTFLDPATAYVEDDVEIGGDTTIGPGVRLCGRTRIGRDCVLEGNDYLTDAELGDGVHVRPMVVITEARVGDGVVIGPFAHLRPGTELGRGVRIGNFVEVKKSSLGDGTKANHLAYLGDATIGRETNIGAGTITCNYDGFEKHPTTIGDRVQVGSDSQLVAPVTVGDDAYVATGTTVRRDVPPGSLAFNPRPEQRREGWVEAFRKRKRRPRE